jgi:hypothetical protein
MKHILLLLFLSGCTTIKPPVEIKEKLMLYEESEVIFKDEHTPASCGSPFSGSIRLR